jgi:two-component system KDP operon response regulator KdpE
MLNAAEKLPVPTDQCRDIFNALRMTLLRGDVEYAYEIFERKAWNRDKTAAGPIINGPLKLDLDHFAAFSNGRKLDLTKKEFNVFVHLMLNIGATLTTRSILINVWGPGHEQDDQYVRIAIQQLRKKIGDDDKTIIITLPYIGYQMVDFGAKP